MGVHWYAKSEELIEIERRFEEVERRIVDPDADRWAIDAALDEREVVFSRAEEARAELELRGLAVTSGSTRRWPPHVLAHADALGPADPGRPLLEQLGWGADYYAENPSPGRRAHGCVLAAARIPARRPSRRVL